MVKYSDGLDSVAVALASPARRQIVDHLSRRPATTSELADTVGLGLPGITRHLDALRTAGLLRSIKRGRTVTHSLDVDALQPLSQWLAVRRSFWTQQLDHLADDLETS